MIDIYDNISDELLAAYLDGNTMAGETRFVENLMSQDTSLIEVMEIAKDSILMSDEMLQPIEQAFIHIPVIDNIVSVAQCECEMVEPLFMDHMIVNDIFSDGCDSNLEELGDNTDISVEDTPVDFLDNDF
ncbi:MAG: hypothetical protein R3Y68_02165 [Rikenellaceae bacterium]